MVRSSSDCSEWLVDPGLAVSLSFPCLPGDLLIFSDGDYGCFDEFYEGGNASYMTSV